MAARAEPSLTQRAFSGALWTASGWGVSAVFQLAFGIAIARILGPRILGIYAAALVVIRFSNVLANIGIGPALVQREEITRRHMRTGMTLSFGLALLIGAATLAGAAAISRFYRMPELDAAIRPLAFVFPLRGLAVVPQALLQRELAFRRLALIETLAYLFGFGVVGVSLALADFGLDALILATISHAALELGLLAWSRPFPIAPQFDRAAARELVGYGGGMTLAGVFGFLAFQGDKLIIGRLLGAASLGLYSRAYSLVATSTRLYQKIATTAFFPLLSRVQADPERLGRGLTRGLAVNALTVLPSSAVLFAIAPELIETLLGAEWLGAIGPFRTLVLFFFLRSAAKLCGPVVMALGRVYLLASIQGVFAALVVAGAWIGARWGISGAAAGVAVAICGHAVLLLHSSLRLTGAGWPEVIAGWYRPLVLAAVLAAETWLLIELASVWSPVSLVVVAVTLGVLAVTLLAGLLWAPRALLGDDGLATLRQLGPFRRLEKWISSRLGRGRA
ncbi:MAG: lipopolysaccharide biosynthesis protein [Thermoanaerobaculia bacterium]